MLLGGLLTALSPCVYPLIPITLSILGARQAGVITMQSTRAGSGRVFPTTRLREAGMLTADNLTPQKARILLALALTVTSDPAAIERIFATY